MKQYKNIGGAQAAQLRAQKPGPVAPPIYRPQPLPVVLQRKVAVHAKQPLFGIKTHPTAGPSTVQLAVQKWNFTAVKKLVTGNAPAADEQKQAYINRLVGLAVGIDAVNKGKLEAEAGKAWDLANPKPKEHKKKEVPAGPNPGWEVDVLGTVRKNYVKASGGGSHKPKSTVWFDQEGDAWSVDLDEHAGPGYKKFVQVANKWHYAGSYDMNLVKKDR